MTETDAAELLKVLARTNRLLRRALREAARARASPRLRKLLHEAERESLVRILGTEDPAAIPSKSTLELARRRARERGVPFVVATSRRSGKVVICPKERLVLEKPFGLGVKDIVYLASPQGKTR